LCFETLGYETVFIVRFSLRQFRLLSPEANTLSILKGNFKMQSQPNFSRCAARHPGAVDWHMLGRLAIIAALAAVPALALAQAGGGAGDAQAAICSLLTKVQNVLTAISIGVVTIAIIFAGYQIAFAHKRITEVAPILIGGILIGAAGQIASTLLSNWGGTASSCISASITPDTVLPQLASIVQSVAGYLA
jgi:type IV secretion system protein VirB2